jgi:hypothetical protein
VACTNRPVVGSARVWSVPASRGDLVGPLAWTAVGCLQRVVPPLSEVGPIQTLVPFITGAVGLGGYTLYLYSSPPSYRYALYLYPPSTVGGSTGDHALLIYLYSSP